MYEHAEHHGNARNNIGHDMSSRPEDNFTPWGQTSPLGANFTPGCQIFSIGAKLKAGLRNEKIQVFAFNEKLNNVLEPRRCRVV
jgi:hypothetical protein